MYAWPSVLQQTRNLCVHTVPMIFSHQVCVRAFVIAGLSCFLFSNIIRAQTDRVEDTRLVEFDEVFALEDTVRLDPSVLIGWIWDLDVNSAGEILITDYGARNASVWSATGQFLRELSVEECDPGAGFQPFGAQFVGNGHIMAYDGRGRAYVFDGAGKCVMNAKGAEFVNITSACAREDTIFAMPHPRPRGAPVAKLKAYSRSLVLLEEIAIEPPQWPNLAAQVVTPGRSLACFDDGVWYMYQGHMDASSVQPQSAQVQYKPPYFVKRRRDAPVDIRRGSSNDAGTGVYGIFSIDGSTRVVAHYPKGEGIGLTIVDHKNRYFAVSTITPFWPEAAGNGMLYFTGDVEMLSNGEKGNPVLIRYRFTPPQNTDN